MRVICLSSVLRCSNLGAVELGWECLNQQGFPDPHLLCLAGTMCEVCGLLLLVVVGFLSRSRSHSHSPSFLLFQAWRILGGGVGRPLAQSSSPASCGIEE